MSYLGNISLFSGDNIGGILELKVARASDISDIPDPVDGVVYGNITFNPGKGFFTWMATRGSSSFLGEGNNTSDGPVKENSLDFVLPKDQPGIKRMLELAEQDELIVLYKDANGNQKIFGAISDPVYFTFSQASGEKTNNRNEYRCRFYADGPDNNFFYNGSIPVAPGGTAPAIVKSGDGTVLATLSPGQIFTLTSPFTTGYKIT